MSLCQTFRTAYLRTATPNREEIFVSVTPRFERGPGIRRDGLTEPRMKDPHSISYVLGHQPPAKWRDLPPTSDPFVQRAGTWTIFHHVKQFCDCFGHGYQIVGVQSCGDLTMNPWHVALIQKNGNPLLCHLSPVTGEELTEPYRERTYRCLVKWRRRPGTARGEEQSAFDFVDLQFDRPEEHYYSATVVDTALMEQWSLDEKNDVAKDIEFALSGKPIIQRKAEIPLANIIDRFQDVRHVFNLPTVAASGAFRGMAVKRLNFGEYSLYNDHNVRRAALNSPVIIDLSVPDSGVQVRLEELKKTLEARHYRFEDESPNRRGRYRLYSKSSIEIFYPHNVYPFGVIGGKTDDLVCLASGGLSGRVGNTLEGVARMMHDFFGCDEAMVLDEGYDTFLLANPNDKAREDDSDKYRYSNDEFLRKVASFTAWRTAADQRDLEKSGSHYSLDEDHKGLTAWHLNKNIYLELDSFCSENEIRPADADELDVVAVPPNRSQMRAVLIVATRAQ